MLCALVLARILGPAAYGVISVATVYVTLSTLVLDQGLAAALVQRPVLNSETPGAVATANLLTGLVLGALTLVLAPWVAVFFSVPNLTPLLRVLGLGLIVKAAAITPRAMQQRNLRFKTIALADTAGGVLGAVAGVTAALLGAGTWSMAFQVVGTDLVIAVVMLAATRSARPNLALRELPDILPFSLRIFGSNGLAFFSRNLDNILVGRFLGVSSLSHYSMAYRVLVIPVQMIGQTVNRVSFPTFARLALKPDLLARTLTKVTELLAFAAVPPMILVSVAAPELVAVVLGPEWAATAPVLTVLAIAGARETVFYITGSLMKAKGEGRLILRYEVLATVVQLSGIIIGLQFGLVGVALGLMTAGFLLAPVMLGVQRRLAGVAIRDQLKAMAPAIHCSAWAAAGYLLVRLVGWNDLGTLVAGSAMYVLIALAVLMLVHRAALRRTVDAGLSILGRGERASQAVTR